MFLGIFEKLKTMAKSSILLSTMVKSTPRFSGKIRVRIPKSQNDFLCFFYGIQKRIVNPLGLDRIEWIRSTLNHDSHSSKETPPDVQELIVLPFSLLLDKQTHVWLPN